MYMTYTYTCRVCYVRYTCATCTSACSPFWPKLSAPPMKYVTKPYFGFSLHYRKQWTAIMKIRIM